MEVLAHSNTQLHSPPEGSHINIFEQTIPQVKALSHPFFPAKSYMGRKSHRSGSGPSPYGQRISEFGTPETWPTEKDSPWLFVHSEGYSKRKARV